MRIHHAISLATALFCVGSAHATPTLISTGGFTLATLHTVPGEPDGYAELLSYSNGTGRIALVEQQAALNAGVAVSTGNNPVDIRTAFKNTYSLSVAPGFEITGLSLSGTWQGVYQAGTGGYVDTYATVGMSLFEYSYENQLPGAFPVYTGYATGQLLDGEQVFNEPSPALHFSDEYWLSFDSIGVRQAMGGTVIDPVTGNTFDTTSLAGISVRDLTLTITVAPIGGPVSPVPEPGAWMLLLGGLGGIALLLRRRQA